MTRTPRLLLIACAALCGCSAVYTAQPVGDRPHDLTAEREQWEGGWALGDGVFTTHVADPTNGVLQLGWFDSDKDAPLRPRIVRVWLRASGDALLASMEPPPEDAAEPRKGLLWARVKLQDGRLLAWAPNPGRIRDEVLAGSLPGVTNGGDVVLGRLTSNQLARFTANASPLFVWDEPLVFEKVTKR